MKRTQIQLPDWLFTAARDVAARKEISLAELVRRGLEYVIATTPGTTAGQDEWKLPAPHNLKSIDPFVVPDWRERLHTERLQVADEGEKYDGDSK